MRCIDRFTAKTSSVHFLVRCDGVCGGFMKGGACISARMRLHRGRRPTHKSARSTGGLN